MAIDKNGTSYTSQGSSPQTGTPITIYDTYGTQSQGTLIGGLAVPNK